MRPARAVPYELSVASKLDLSRGALELRFENRGGAAAVFQVRAGMSELGPWTYTVGPKRDLSETWAIRDKGQGTYDYSVYGPNGFFRSYRGGTQWSSANLLVRADYDREGGITLFVVNSGSRAVTFRIYDAYSKRTQRQSVNEGRSHFWHWDLDTSHGWYDLTVTVENDAAFLQRLAGHVETGKDSVSDPAFGA